MLIVRSIAINFFNRTAALENDVFSPFYALKFSFILRKISHAWYQLCQLFLPIPDTADCPIVGTDYELCRIQKTWLNTRA